MPRLGTRGVRLTETFYWIFRLTSSASLTVDGSMVPKDREVALDKIRNSSKTKAILISFKAGSTGMHVCVHITVTFN